MKNERNNSGFSSMDKPWLKEYPEDVYSKVTTDIYTKMYDFMYQKNINGLDDYAIRYFGKNISYRELFTNIDAMAKILKGYGVVEGDIVSLCLPNIPEVIYIKYALNRLGAVANMIEPRHSPNSILSYVNKSHSKLLFVILEACESKINPIIDKLRVDDIVILTAADSLNVTDGITPALVNLKYMTKKLELIAQGRLKDTNRYSFIKDFSKWSVRSNGQSLDGQYIENSAATIVYTSGTTGSSKGAVLSNEAYNCMYNQLQYTAEFKRGDTFFGAIPFFSAYGSFCGMHNSLCSGQQIIMIPKFVPSKVAEEVMKHKPNIAFLVPGYWKTITQDKKAQKEDFSYLKIIVAGGDKMAPVTVNEINTFFTNHNCDTKVRVGYGASEFGGAVSVVPDSELYIPGSAGLVLPSCTAMVINPDTKEELEYNEKGEICISSPTMMIEYLNEEQETNNLVIYKNGLKYYRTGDEGYIDENGIVYVIDRYKRSMMRPDGHTVHATPIENKILEYPGVEQCCVVGLKYKNIEGVIPTAFVVSKSDIQTDIDTFFRQVDAYCLTTLSERERAMAYVRIDTMPYNLMGKIDYRKLEQNKLEELESTTVDYTFIEKNKVLKK